MKKSIKPFSTTISVSSDDRGVFVPFFDVIANQKTSRGDKIKRLYYVYNYGSRVIRGFHFHKKEWKFFIIVSGAAKFVAIDPKHPKEKYIFTSSSRFPNLIVVPPEYANAWMSLTDDTILICASTATLSESIRDDIRYDPYEWGDVWKVKPR